MSFGQQELRVRGRGARRIVFGRIYAVQTGMVYDVDR